MTEKRSIDLIVQMRTVWNYHITNIRENQDSLDWIEYMRRHAGK